MYYYRTVSYQILWWLQENISSFRQVFEYISFNLQKVRGWVLKADCLGLFSQKQLQWNSLCYIKIYIIVVPSAVLSQVIMHILGCLINSFDHKTKPLNVHFSIK